jgi:hypothetical protein
MYDRRQRVACQFRAFVVEKASHDEDTCLFDAALAQSDTFIDRADSEPSGALLNQPPGDFQRSMTVSIGLNDGGNFDVLPYYAPNAAVITGDLVERDKNVGAIAWAHSSS